MRKVSLVVSDQVENTTAAGSNEAATVAPIGAALKTMLQTAGWNVQLYDPKKSYSMAPVVAFNPDVVLFIHVDSTGSTQPGGILIVCDSQDPDMTWEKNFGKRVAMNFGWGFRGVSTDWALREFRYWFYRGLPELSLPLIAVGEAWRHPERVVIEMGNMQCYTQARALLDNPATYARAIADALLSMYPEEVDVVDKQEHWWTAKARISGLNADFRFAIEDAEKAGNAAEVARLKTAMATDIAAEKLKLDPTHEIWDAPKP
jgi:hypothetical protein